MNKIFNKAEKGSELYEVRTDIMRYKNNSISFWLCIVAIIFNVLMFLIVYQNSNCTSDIELGVDLLINVCLMLGMFLLSEKTKSYNKNGSYIAIGFGVIQIARIFWIPLKYFLNNLKYLEALREATESGQSLQYTGVVGMTSSDFTLCVVYLSLSALCLIAAGIIAIFKANRLNEHIEKIEGSEKENKEEGK